MTEIVIASPGSDLPFPVGASRWGLGVYLQRGGLSRRTARRLRVAGVRHVALCAEAVSGWRATGAQLSSWAADARAEGLAVHVYSFPGSDAVQQPADVAAHLTASSLLVRASTAILDAEAPYQRRGPALRATLDACVAGSGGIPVAVTTLGSRATAGRAGRGRRWRTGRARMTRAGSAGSATSAQRRRERELASPSTRGRGAAHACCLTSRSTSGAPRRPRDRTAARAWTRTCAACASTSAAWWTCPACGCGRSRASTTTR